ncbi:MULTISPECIES: hypothetical protein [unclassified Bradyrhizobium]|uniref:Uncharacterized protein n=1 Tax=Bradyrhizobium sp. LLZ17 TaxID=3239388 RepID=A0AB39XSZ0_9BRAD
MSDAFDQWVEWRHKPPGERRSIPAELYAAVMSLPEPDRSNRQRVNETIRSHEAARREGRTVWLDLGWIVLLKPFFRGFDRRIELGPIGFSDRCGRRIARVEPNRSLRSTAFHFVLPGHAFRVVFLEPPVGDFGRCKHLHPAGADVKFSLLTNVWNPLAADVQGGVTQTNTLYFYINGSKSAVASNAKGGNALI